jgi:glycosyltransferase involved in cell wall biosynthesis
MGGKGLGGRCQPCVWIDDDGPMMIGSGFGACTVHVRSPGDQKEYGVHLSIGSAANPGNPEGHLGAWECHLGQAKETAICVESEMGRIRVSCPPGKEATETWVNADWRRHHDVLGVHIDLFGKEDGAHVFEDYIFLYQTEEHVARAWELRRALLDRGKLAQCTVRRPFEWPRRSVVHLLAHDIFRGDGVGNFALDVYGLFALNDMKCQMYAVNFDRHLRGPIRHTAEIFSRVAQDDLIFFNFSIYDPYLPEVGKMEARKVLYFHGITPPDLLRDHDPRTAALCERGLAQIPHAREFGSVLANSNWTAEQLSKYLRHSGPGWDRTEKETMTVEQCPPVLGLTWEHEAAGRMPGFSTGEKTLLYVGRLAPHKRVDDVIRVFGEFYQRQPQARLLIVGQSAGESYTAYLKGVADGLPLEARARIEFLGFVSDEELKSAYRQADAFITMSEHEGFCIPLVEAMHFNLPIFAYAQGAVKATMGGAGICFDNKDYFAIAEHIDGVLANDHVRRQVLEGQRQRLRELVGQANGAIIWQALRTEIGKNEGIV